MADIVPFPQIDTTGLRADITYYKLGLGLILFVSYAWLLATVIAHIRISRKVLVGQVAFVGLCAGIVMGLATCVLVYMRRDAPSNTTFGAFVAITVLTCILYSFDRDEKLKASFNRTIFMSYGPPATVLLAALLGFVFAVTGRGAHA